MITSAGKNFQAKAVRSVSGFIGLGQAAAGAAVSQHHFNAAFSAASGDSVVMTVQITEGSPEHHRIVLNRAFCRECRTEVISYGESESCTCRALVISGGQTTLRRTVQDGADWEERSLLTKTYVRLGVVNVEAYEASIPIYVRHNANPELIDFVGPDGKVMRRLSSDMVDGRAEVGDMVVYEPDNSGATAWKKPAFWAWHELVPEL